MQGRTIHKPENSKGFSEVPRIGNIIHCHTELFISGLVRLQIQSLILDNTENETLHQQSSQFQVGT